MIALDTNVLVHAHRRDSPQHSPAVAAVASLADGTERWVLPWPCVAEFCSVVTRSHYLDPPTAVQVALDQVQAWLDSPVAVLLGESSRTWATWRSLVAAADLRGGRVHDARIAAICLDAGVDELWTADRDYSRFPALRTRNPLVDP